jgi:hypothetical protein
MNESPNHALQRTAPRLTARAFCERSGSYIWASGVRATVAELGVVGLLYIVAMAVS